MAGSLSPKSCSKNLALLVMRLASLLAFAVVLLLDVAGTVLLGTGGQPAHIVKLLRLHFLLGESSIDLLALAAARGLLAPLVLLAGLRAAGLRKVTTAPSAESPPLLEPLQLNAETRAVPDAAAPKRRRLPAVTSLRCSAALMWVAVLYSSGKALARMLQAGLGIHGGMLPVGGTTDPTELLFWLTLSVGPVCACAEHALVLRLLRKPGPAGADGAAKSARKSRGTEPKKAEDPAETAKKAYLERTQPDDIRSVRAIMAMVKPDWHLLIFAYASLVVAAAGDTTIPFLYGQLIDAIAINRDAARSDPWNPDS